MSNETGTSPATQIVYLEKRVAELEEQLDALSQQPESGPEKWISCEERLPTDEDKDLYGEILWLRSGVKVLGKPRDGRPVDATHWTHSHNYTEVE